MRLLLAPLVTLLAAAPLLASDTLPTPYTAEQIRDSWTEGLEVWIELETPEGKQISVTTVTSWSLESVTTCEQLVDAERRPQGEKACSESTWDELRRHATFPASMAERSRTRETTPLGDLEGWLYVVRNPTGAVSEFFFADSTPGAPAAMRQKKDDEVVFEMVQFERRVTN